jgi:Mlc titration factor MtfA (ptsG expression regulator)
VVGVVAIPAAGGLGALVAGPEGAVVGATLGLSLAVGVSLFGARRFAGRSTLLGTPFPHAWRELLAARCDHYDRLPDDWRRRFEDDVRILVAETRITGVAVDVTDELRLLVAASAATLSLGWPDYEWSQLKEVLLYPEDFDRDYRFGGDDRVGEAHPWGTIILSAPALEESFAFPDEAFHVGLHEFAHLLDMEGESFAGVPRGLDAAASREWVGVMEKEMARLRKGKSALDPYGADDPAEFLGVAVEAFFQIPLEVRRRHREVYAILSAYFGQDPAAWDDARGIVL